MKTNQDEVWVEAWDFPTYEVSNLGNIRNAKTEKQLKTRTNGRDYRMVSIWYQGKKYTKRISRLIWQSFNREFCKATIDHINRDGGDDRLENLRCVSMKENRANRPNMKKENKYKLTDEIKGEIYNSLTDGTETSWSIMKKYGIPSNYIQTIMKRQTWKKYAGTI